MYLLILFLPLCGSITAGLLGRKLGPSGAHFASISSLATASLLALLAFYEVAVCDSPVTINLGSWINSDLLNINWLFYFDQLSVTMLVVVTVVSLMVHIYSIYYMAGEPHQQRFFSYLSLFTFFMLVLIAGGNYLILFIGWEGIGVSSYLLINYYYTRLAANKAAILAFNQNRVGDWILSVGFFAMISVFGSLDYDVIFNLAPSINPTLITIICLLLFIGASAKSAVLGLHSWLPGSMEANDLLIQFLKLLISKLKSTVIMSPLFKKIFKATVIELCLLIWSFCLIIIIYFVVVKVKAIISNSLNNNDFLITFFELRCYLDYQIVGNFDVLYSSINPLIYAITGNMLGDGHLRYTHKDKDGKPTLFSRQRPRWGKGMLVLQWLKKIMSIFVIYIIQFICPWLLPLYLDLDQILILDKKLNNTHLIVNLHLFSVDYIANDMFDQELIILLLKYCL